MSYLHSSQVYVFPAAIPRDNFPASRALSELNLSNLVRIATGKPSFVITPEFNSEFKFEFVIEGYYICLLPGDKSHITFATGNPVYAVIFIAKDNEKFPMLCGSDSNGEFTGVSFVDNIDDVTYPAGYTAEICDMKYLHILDPDSNNSFVVPKASLQQPTIIDGGEWKKNGNGNYVEI